MFYKPQQVAEPVEDAAEPEVLPAAEIDDVPDVDAEDEARLTADTIDPLASSTPFTQPMRRVKAWGG